MKKIIFSIMILAVLTLSACSLEGESPVFSHLQNQDPSKLHTDPIMNGNEKNETKYTNDPRCIGQYTSDDIKYRDLEKQAVIEKNINLCYQMPDEPLLVECESELTLVYYSKDRCIEELS